VYVLYFQGRFYSAQAAKKADSGANDAVKVTTHTKSFCVSWFKL